MKSTSMMDYASEAERTQTLGRILPLWPNEISDRSLGGQEQICRLLGAALRRERQRGVAGHWAYDLGRHAALAAALVQERRRLEALQARSPDAVTVAAQF